MPKINDRRTLLCVLAVAISENIRKNGEGRPCLDRKIRDVLYEEMSGGGDAWFFYSPYAQPGSFYIEFCDDMKFGFYNEWEAKFIVSVVNAVNETNLEYRPAT